MQAFNTQDVANTLWAIAETGTQMPDAFEALCTVVTQEQKPWRLCAWP